MPLGLYGQSVIEELSISFEDDENILVTPLSGSGDCDTNPGIFGIQDGAFVINDMEGETCCTDIPTQGLNDNRALIGPVLALNTYCNVNITINVSLSTTDFESCLSEDINPVGCTGFIPSLEPGGDGFELQTILNGDIILTSGYCGGQRKGTYTFNIGDVQMGDAFTFIITGGTQDEDEIYSINSIDFEGGAMSFIPALISVTDTVLCAGIDPLVLTEVSGGVSHQWSKDGVSLNSSGFSYNSGGAVSTDDEGLYRVIVTDAGGCSTIDEVYIEVVSLTSKLVDPTFSNLDLTYCLGDTIVLPSKSDEGVAGNWNINAPFVIEDLNAIDSLYFEPDDILFSPVSFNVVIQDYILATYRDTICITSTITLGGVVFDSSRLTGTFLSSGGAVSCDTLYTVALSLSSLDTTQFNQTVCPGDTFDIGGELFHNGRLSGIALVTRDGFCDTYVEVSLSLGTIQSTVTFDPCTDLPIFDGVVLTNDTTYTISGNGVICDSVFTIRYQPLPGLDTMANFLICSDDSLVYDNRVLSFENPIDTFSIVNEIGCPRNLIVSLDFIQETIVPYDISICFGDTINVEGELFYVGKLNGLVRHSNGFCDTLYDVNLTINTSMQEFVTIDPCVGPSSFLGVAVSQDTMIIASGRNGGCDTIYNVIYNPSTLADSILQLSICTQDSVTIAGTLYHAANTTGVFEIVTDVGCRRNILVDVTLEDGIIEVVRDTFCSGTELVIGGEVFDVDNPQGRVVFTQNVRCDSIIVVELEFVTLVERELNIIICDYDTVIINGLQFYNGAEDMGPIIYGPNGCDTSLTIIPTYMISQMSIVEMSFCTDELVTIGGEVFGPDRPNGTVLIPKGNGCDSIVEVRLEYAANDTVILDRQLCTGQSIDVGGVTYNASNPNGIATLRTQLGCDSVVMVSLSFGTEVRSNFEQLICSDEQIFIGSQFYDANNLFGTEQFLSSSGCDSIVEISILLDTVEVDILSTGTCRQSRTGAIEVTLLSQDTLEISLAGVTTSTSASQVVFEDLGIGEYSIVVISDRGCFFVYPVEVKATFANDVSYTLTDGGFDFYEVTVNITGLFQSIIWEPSPDLSCIDCLTPSIRKGGGIYRAVIQDLEGCITTIEVPIVEEAQAFFYIPNVINPNGQADNNTFYLQASEEGIRSYDMAIFDRWGQPIYDAVQLQPNDRDAGWNGLSKGTSAVNGVYVYSMIIRHEDGQEERRYGEILVIN